MVIKKKQVGILHATYHSKCERQSFRKKCNSQPKKKKESSVLVFLGTTQRHFTSYKVKYIYKGIDQSQLSESSELSLRFLPTPLGEPSVQEMMTSFF